MHCSIRLSEAIQWGIIRLRSKGVVKRGLSIGLSGKAIDGMRGEEMIEKSKNYRI